MAEAIVEERTTMPPRYYCHMCNVEINIPNADFTCPLCAGGFVEELPAQSQPTTNANGASTSRSGSDPNQEPAPLNRIADINALRGELATMLMDRFGTNIEISLDPGNMGGARNSESNSNGQETGGANSNPNRTAAARMRRNFGPNMLYDFLSSLDGQLNTSMVYLGNIGDYAWGREGIDTVVTQLLNQMETAGPPPLSRERIDEIPKVQVTQDDVDKKIQCSVCWEDFQLDEIVRKLPCSHIYHENCIVPWLDLHGTCPICRKSLSSDDEHGGSDDSGGGVAGSNDRRADGGSSGGGRVVGPSTNGPPIMRNSALDDLD